MEVAVEQNTSGKESVFRTDCKEDADKCNHFTIRGYVASVRKRDVKICWPLFIPNNGSSDTLANMLPPLHVSKFKRWSCLNCLHSIGTSADVTGNADFTHVQNKEITPNNLFLSNSDAKRLFSGSNQSAKNFILGKRLLSDSPINAIHGEHSSAPCHGKKESEFTAEDAAKEGIQVFICGNVRSEENRDQSCKPISAFTEDEEFQARKTQTGKMTVSENNSGNALLCHDASPMVCAKSNRGICASDGILTFRGSNVAVHRNKNNGESRMMVGIDLCISKDDAPPATAANVINYDLMCLDQNNDEASFNNVDLSDGMNYSQNQNGVFSNLHEKLNNKKVRKVRLLEDIMQSEKIHIPIEVHTFRGDKEMCGIKNNHDGGSDGSKYENQTGEYQNNLVSQNSEVAPTDPFDSLEYNWDKDEELSLMNWLKKVSKKFVTDDSQKKKAIVVKRSAKNIKNKVGVSSSTHNKKDVDPLPKGSVVSKHNKEYTVEKENKVARVKPIGNFLIPQQEILISKDAMMNHVLPPKMRCTISANVLPPYYGELDRRCNQKTDFNRRKKKASQVEDRKSSQINWPKKEVTKKQRTTKTLHKETLDDIPMDIVELLAKNRHEKILMNAEIANKNKHELPMLHGNNSYVSSRYCGSKVSNAIYKNHVTFHDKGYDLPTTSCGNQNADYEEEACKSVKSQKRVLIDLNQQSTDFLTIPEYEEHLRATHFPAADSEKIHSLQSSSWDRVMLQDLGSYQKDQGVSLQSSSGGYHHMLPSSLKGGMFGVNTGNIDAYCNYGKMVPYDSFLDGSQKIVTQCTDSHEQMNLNNSPFLSEGGKSEQPTNRTPLVIRSFLMEGGCRCQSGRTAPMDLHINETVSALHLLRLVDQAALSGASWDVNRIRIAQDSILPCNNQYNGMIGANFGIKIRENPENLFSPGCSARDQNDGNFSKPHRPVPRIGFLGSLLQKEIMTDSKIAPLSSKARCYDKLSSFCTDGMEKTDCPFSAISTAYGDRNTRLSVDTSTKQIVQAGDSFANKFEIGQMGISRKDEPAQSVRHDCVTISCVINRNPADFSLPDEDNIYMRGIEDLNSKHVLPHHQKEKYVSPQNFMASNSS